MIQIITQVAREHPKWFRIPNSQLSFMKVSTPASGRGLDEGKVILFVFEEGEKIPTLCVKTTRAYNHKRVIMRNHENLKLLEAGAQGSECVQMFARPLYLHDDGEIIFCVESVCPGTAFSGSLRETRLFAEKYGAWQAHLSRATKKFWRAEDIRKLACRLIVSLGLSEESARILTDYYHGIALNPNVKLPMIVQHGDMTPDNVLVLGENIYFIDYDYVDGDYIPGFDMFNLFSKMKLDAKTMSMNCKRYFPAYFRDIGADIESCHAVFFIYCLQEMKRKGHIVSDEKRVLDKMLALLGNLMK